MTDTGIPIYLTVDFTLVLSLAVLVHLSLSFTLQSFARLVQHVLKSLAHGRFMVWSIGALAKLWIAVTVQPVNSHLAVAPRIFFTIAFSRSRA